MPMPETFGAQPTIELLRQLISKGGFFDRHKHNWKIIEDMNIICAAAPAGGGRNPMTQRFTRFFNIINLVHPSEKTLKTIFGSILRGFVNSYNFSEQVKYAAENAVAATIEIYKMISKELLPIPSKFFYSYSIRDISRVKKKKKFLVLNREKFIFL